MGLGNTNLHLMDTVIDATACTKASPDSGRPDHLNKPRPDQGYSQGCFLNHDAILLDSSR
jgi:hypothetical protein